ncbi:CHASE2 domain-containing protein [Phenylobacterium sp. SCN 70-31]|uniref:CHASE2 domain-containing protein n=1 Tax=Phenylobacterium sp. SCN 70-31 TaxID=1660129 RepID=UPI0025EF79BB|nr:CHASE2 domain-containing protein [Phenylobacterium sp. SCN 70-31]
MRPPQAQRRRILAEWVAVAALSSIVLLLAVLGGAATRLDNLFYDAMTRLSARPPSADIVVVAIDNRSIAEIGRWPWPRSEHATLLRRLAEAKPRAVAYDVLLVDPDRDPAVDADLAAAVALTPTLLPASFDVPGRDGAPYEIALPVRPLRAAAAGVGHVNVAFDADGVVRRAFLSQHAGDQEWPHLMELMARQTGGGPSPTWRAARPPAAAPDTPPGIVRTRPVMVAYGARPGDIRTVSFVDLMRGETPAEVLRDRLVLVGATADGLGDRYATPLSGGEEVMPGVEMQANLLDTLLSGRAVRPLDRTPLALFALAPLWVVLAGFLVLRPRANLALGLAVAAVVLIGSGLLLVFGRIWAPPAATLVALALVLPLWSWRRLEASSAFMTTELRRFAAEPDVLPTGAATARPAGEVIAQQMDLMEAALEQARDLRRFLHDVIQGLPDATVVLAADGKVLVANRAAENLFAAIAGRAPVGETLDHLAAALTPQPAADGEVETEATAPDGRTFVVRRTPLLTARGGRAGEIVRYADVTSLKAAGRQREDILQLLTHDMRSPQVSILALLDNHPVAPDLSTRLRGYARRTLDLADDFVHLSRAETASLTTEPVDMVEVALDALDDLWPQSQAKSLMVNGPDADTPLLVAGDRGLLTRTLINLLDNAIKYTEPGGRITCDVRLDESRSPPRVVCTIADTGRGMPPEEAAQVFERFRRARGEANRGVSGAGLGLAFVQTVVQRHGGAITCESRPGEGTRFEIVLPRLDQPDEPEPESDSLAALG